MIEIASVGSLDALRKVYDPAHVERALKLANSKTAQKARTQISKLVRQTYNVKARDIAKNSSIKRMQGRDSDILLFYQGQRLNLKYFDARETKNFGVGSVTTYRAKNGFASRRAKRKTKSSKLTVRIRKDKGRETVRALHKFGGYGVGRYIQNKGFFARINSRGINVFARDGADRFPVVSLTGPSIPQMIGGEEVLKKALDFIAKEHVEQFSTHLDKLMNGVIK